MRKGRYRCKRYLLYLPVAIGDQVDRSVDYFVRLFGPAIVLVPEGVDFSFSRVENSISVNRANDTGLSDSSTDSLRKVSKMNGHGKPS